jgi:hypothetical protein
LDKPTWLKRLVEKMAILVEKKNLSKKGSFLHFCFFQRAVNIFTNEKSAYVKIFATIFTKTT